MIASIDASGTEALQVSLIILLVIVVVLMSAEMDGEKGGEEEQLLPLVLLLHPMSSTLSHSLSKRFRLLKAWEEEASIPMHRFLASHAQSVRALICSAYYTLDSATLSCLPSLECVVTTSVGVDHIDMAECRRRGISVANAGTAFSEDVADYAIGLFLDVLRRISASDRYLRRGHWPLQGECQPLGSKLKCKQVGIVGLGSVGLEIAKRLEGFGCQIAYNARTKKPLPYPYFSDVRDLASASDVLIIACALTDETYHLINRDVLLALGKDGVVINVGRGAVINEKALVRCLVQGEVGGAGFDVFENEPDVPQEFFMMDNVVLSPHRAVFTSESLSTLVNLITWNLEAFFSNKPLLTLVE